MPGISESASEKLRRGRPRVFSDRLLDGLNSVYGNMGGTGTRKKQNTVYAHRAAGLLLDHAPRFAWLLSDDPPVFRKSILVELGRFGDPEESGVAKEILEAAAAVCKRKPKTKDAVAMVRARRLGRKPKADGHALAKEIVRVVNEYIDRHEGTSWDDVLLAMTVARAAIEEAASK